MKFNPDRHKNISLRLQNYDYSSKWLYFITIAVQNKLCLFWSIENNIMIKKSAWEMIEWLWFELENDFPNIKLHDFIIMPNHIHWIIEIVQQNKECTCTVCRDTPCGYPDINKYTKNIQENYFLKDIDGVQNMKSIKDSQLNIQDTHKGCPYNRNNICNIIGGFKSKTTHQYIQWVYNSNWSIFNKKLWQKDFYEHIIRDDTSYNNISEYIQNNPIKWEEDKFYYTEV